MTPTPPSTTSSSTGGRSPADEQYRIVRKRNRVPLSCAPCRHRKLKCNRSHPCENCVKRGDASSCSYAAPGTRKKPAPNAGSTTPDDMQNRIDRLEGLVLSLMTNGAQSAGPTAAAEAISRSASESTRGGSRGNIPETVQEDDDMLKDDMAEDSDLESVSNSFGILKVDNEKHKAMYYGDSHWHMVLSDIAEVKNYFANHKKELEKHYQDVKTSQPISAQDGLAFLNPQPRATEVELRAELPGKSAVDKLVTRYLNSYDPAVHVLHSPTFYKQLHDHWQDPSKTSLVWLGLLYSVMCLAMQSYHKIGDEPPEWKGRTQELANEYRLRTVQCLVASDYTKSSENTIETLILYVHGEYSSRWDSEVGIYVVVGMIVRLALRMGYHRDAARFTSISPFQGEMRRRIWAFIRQMDSIFSFQLALPSMIRSQDCDAELPRNIFEDEFGPNTDLPPARPLTEPTPVSYMIIKAKMSYEFGAIVEELNAVSGPPVSYEQIMAHDNRVRDLKRDMPPHLKVRPIDECMHDPATLLMQRIYLDLYYQKTLCVLHRKYIARAHQNPRYSYSRRACVDAANEIIRHQAHLHRESQRGGRLRSMKWFISSLTTHDFLLGAMIVCLDLHYDAVSAAERPQNNQAYEPYFWTPDQRAEMFAALEGSVMIWKESADTSLEAFKACKVLGIMLEKLKNPVQPAKADSEANQMSAFTSFDQDKPEHSAAMTLGMLSGGLTPNSAAMFNNTAPSPPTGAPRFGNYDMVMAGDSSSRSGISPNFTMDSANTYSGLNAVASPFSSVFGNNTQMMDPSNLDWEAWDSYIQTGTTLDSSFQFNLGPFDQSQMNPDIQTDQNNNPFSNSVFMGANTPGRG